MKTLPPFKPSARDIKARLRRVSALLKARPHSAAFLLSSDSAPIQSRDQHYPFRQNSDFFYLTGSGVQGGTLLISNTRSTPILFWKRPTAHEILWEGRARSPRELSRQLGAELVLADDPKIEIRRALHGIDELVFQNDERTQAWSVAHEIIKTPSAFRGKLPRKFTHIDEILAPMREIKSPDEIKALKLAAKITVDSLYTILPLIRSGVTEKSLANALEFNYSLRGGEIAFNSIMATGKNAATLHYHALASKLRTNELLLIDVGASYGLYCSDITRCIPASGLFAGATKDLYQIVLSAQQAALRRVRHNALVSEIYNAAAKELSHGLSVLRVFGRKSGSDIYKQGLYKKYFPHGIGHQIGLDTHDIGGMRGDGSVRLKAGMVLTIEPGLYFPRSVGTLPACGVRIEDTVHVTKNGCENLTAAFPKEISEIESAYGAT